MWHDVLSFDISASRAINYCSSLLVIFTPSIVILTDSSLYLMEWNTIFRERLPFVSPLISLFIDIFCNTVKTKRADAKDAHRLATLG